MMRTAHEPRMKSALPPAMNKGRASSTPPSLSFLSARPVDSLSLRLYFGCSAAYFSGADHFARSSGFPYIS
jgi:hypothetical protein